MNVFFHKQLLFALMVQLVMESDRKETLSTLFASELTLTERPLLEMDF